MYDQRRDNRTMDGPWQKSSIEIKLALPIYKSKNIADNIH